MNYTLLAIGLLVFFAGLVILFARHLWWTLAIVLLGFPLCGQTVILADDEALLRQFRRWEPFLPVVGDTKWPPANDTAIADPATEETEPERKVTRLAAWQPAWGGLTNPQKRDLGYNAFESWIKPCKAEAIAKAQTAMNADDPVTYPDPEAITNPQIRAWVTAEFSLWELSETVPDWAHGRGCGGGSLHLGPPAIGDSATAFGGGCVASRCAMWSHTFTEIQLHWIEALVEQEGLTARFQFLSAKPADWIGAE